MGSFVLPVISSVTLPECFLVFVDVRVYSWFATQPERKKKARL